MKTSCFKRTLAILLSVLLAMPLFVLTTFAEEFSLLPTYTSDLNEGDLWYNSAMLYNDTGNSVYQNASYYLSSDQNTLKIEYTSGDETTTELYERSTDPQLFTYLTAMPAFGPALPTSPDGLADGDYWFDVESYVTLFYGSTATKYRGASYYLSVDGTLIRRSYDSYGFPIISDEQVALQSNNMPKFLRQVGVDPNAGFTLLPKSADGLTDGDYWFDVDGFTQTYGGSTVYTNAEYYLSDDCNTIRVYLTASSSSEWTRENHAYVFAFLKQVGVDPNAGFTLLPKSDEGLADGEWWIDVSSLVALLSGDTATLYLNADYYLSDDGHTMRMISDNFPQDYAEDSSTGEFLFGFLRQVGVEPNAGFTLLPTSDEGLEDGAYWYDAAGLAAAAGDANAVNYQYYLSDDGTTLRLAYNNNVQDKTRESEDGSTLFRFLRQVGVDPNAGFTLLPTSADGLEYGDYWYDAAGLAAAINDENAVTSQYYLSDDGNTLRMISSDNQIDIARTDDYASTFFAYLCQVGVDPNAGFTRLPTSADGLEDGAYWYDAAGLANFVEDDDYLTYEYYISDDGNTLRAVVNGTAMDISSTDEGFDVYYRFLHQVGVDPNAGFTLLPKSPDGLAFGAYWFDAAGIAADTGEAYYADSDAYLNADGSVLRAIILGQTFDFPKGEEDSEFVYAYLHEVTTDPDTGVSFIHLPKSPDGLAIGDYWYDAAGIAEATEQSYLVNAEAYLSADGNLIRVLIMGETLDFPKGEEDSDLVYSFLRQADGSTIDPNAGFTLLPTSADGLSDGDYWFDIVGFAAYSGSDDYLNAQYYLKNDGSVLRMIVNGTTEDIPKEKDSSRYYYNFLMQVGHDPVVEEGFLRLPTSDAGLADGEWWYDAAALSEAFSLPYDNARFYLSADGTTLRMIFGDQTDYTRDTEQGAVYFNYLRQAGVDPNAGFTLLPTSEEGLENGAYWFDAAGLNMLTANAFADAQFYLSDDGATLRVVSAATEDYTRDSEEGETIFTYLRTVGVDPNEGFILLPTSSDGLNVGDLWFDAAAVAEAENDQDYLHYTYYISEDGNTLRVSAFGYPNDMTADSEDGAFFFPYLKHVAGEPGTAYLTMTASAQTVRRGDTVTVTVDLAQNPGLAGMTLSLGYDADVLTLTDVQAGGMFETGNLTVGGDLAVQPYNVLWDDATSHEAHAETGTILTLTFVVKDTAVAGDTTITMTYDAEGTFDVDLQNVPVIIITGALLMIDTHLPGDVDDDGEVDLADVIALTRFLAGGWDVTVKADNCDVNGDNSVDLKDVILIRRFLAGGWDVELI